MSLDITLITRNRVLAAKAETTTGTAIATTATDCALFGALYEPKITPTIPPNQRTAQQYLSPLNPVPGATAGKLTFRSELFSLTANTAPPWASVLFPACGCAVASGVVTPLTPSASNGLATITAGLYQAGQYKFLAGCMGDFTIHGKTGGPLYIDWSFEGVWQSPTATAIPASIAYPTAKPPRFAGATFTAGSNVLRCSEFSFKVGNKIYLREDPAAVDGASVGTGYRAAMIVYRLPTITVDPESFPLGTWNAWSAQMALTTYAFTATVGASGNGFTLAAPAAQINTAPQDKDRGGIMANDLEFICTGAADSEWSLTYL